jgi:hypothetical protein
MNHFRNSWELAGLLIALQRFLVGQVFPSGLDYPLKNAPQPALGICHMINPPTSLQAPNIPSSTKTGLLWIK